MTRSCAFISFSLTVQPSLFRIFVNCSILKRRGSATHRTLPNLRRKAFSYRTPEQSQHGVQQRPAEASVAMRCITRGYTDLHRRIQTRSWITNRPQTCETHRRDPSPYLLQRGTGVGEGGQQFVVVIGGDGLANRLVKTNDLQRAACRVVEQTRFAQRFAQDLLQLADGGVAPAGRLAVAHHKAAEVRVHLGGPEPVVLHQKPRGYLHFKEVAHEAIRASHGVQIDLRSSFRVAGSLGEHGLQLRLLKHIQATQADLRDVLTHPKRGVLDDILGFCEVDDVAVGHALLATLRISDSRNCSRVSDPPLAGGLTAMRRKGTEQEADSDRTFACDLTSTGESFRS